MRAHNRAADEMRPLTVERNIQPNADASVFIKLGNTHVICAVTVEEKVPAFLEGSSSGWITAEYGMLPGATSTRYRRESATGRSGRTLEIQRLIGRSLRMMVDLKALGERTLRVDCDVVNADGGTRTAAITGAAIALRNAVGAMAAESRIAALPAMVPVAAVSAGIVDGRPMLDLDYLEDSRADCDANFVMAADGRWVEIQTSAEGSPFSLDAFLEMTELARRGGRVLFDLW